MRGVRRLHRVPHHPYYNTTQRGLLREAEVRTRKTMLETIGTALSTVNG
jgi:hypothetical protein